MTTKQRWSGIRVVPSAPLVFGNGTSQAAFGGHRHLLPPQPTMAGFIRARFWDPASSMSPSDQAKELVDGVSLRGPWLVATRGERAARSLDSIWVPAPSDARVASQETALLLSRPAHPIRLDESEGAWFGQAAGDAALWPVHLDDRINGAKTRRLSFPLWRLDHVLSWGLGHPPCPTEAIVPVERRPVLIEDRVHVGIDDKRGTATAEALFATRGVRIVEGYAIAADARHPTLFPSDGVAVLGGRSRPARVDVGTPAWPSFDVVKPLYQEAIAGRPDVLLRLQLVTPGMFGGWRPDEERLPAGMRLVAALVPGMRAHSGWNMVQKRPRAVRRSVPAGAVYWFVVERDRLLSLCEHFWEHPLPGAPPSAELLARPEADGFGQVIPGLAPLEAP